MSELKRWAIANRLYLLSFLLVTFIAYIDTIQIQTFHTLNSQQAWDLYNQHTLPSFVSLWAMMIIVPAIVYYLFVRDLSESIGIAAAGLILLFTGVEDVLFFIFSGSAMTSCMSWFADFNAPIYYWSKWVFNEACVSPKALISFAIIGIILSYYIFKILERTGYKNGKRISRF